MKKVLLSTLATVGFLSSCGRQMSSINAVDKVLWKCSEDTGAISVDATIVAKADGTISGTFVRSELRARRVVRTKAWTINGLTYKAGNGFMPSDEFTAADPALNLFIDYAGNSPKSGSGHLTLDNLGVTQIDSDISCVR